MADSMLSSYADISEIMLSLSSLVCLKQVGIILKQKEKVQMEGREVIFATLMDLFPFRQPTETIQLD